MNSTHDDSQTVTDYPFFHLCINLSGTSSVAVAWSGTFDELIGGHILDFFKENIPMNASGLAPYPDFFAVGLILILSGNHVSLCLVFTVFCWRSAVVKRRAFLVPFATQACWRSESRSQPQSTRSSRPSTSWCCCLWLSLDSSRATSATGRSAKKSWSIPRNETSHVCTHALPNYRRFLSCYLPLLPQIQ